MRFQAHVTVSNGLAGPDPVATPDLVPDALLSSVPDRRAYADASTTRGFLALDAPAGETVTVSLYALDEATVPTDRPPTGTELAARRFYLLAAAQVVTAGSLLALTGAPPGGTIYVRPTADTLTGSGTLLIAVL
jgi:hypothetical protein